MVGMRNVATTIANTKKLQKKKHSWCRNHKQTAKHLTFGGMRLNVCKALIYMRFISSFLTISCGVQYTKKYIFFVFIH